jgi:glycogen operon protein
LGATWDGAGVNFAIFSEHAAKVELCLFNAVTDITETHRNEQQTIDCCPRCSQDRARA